MKKLRIIITNFIAALGIMTLVAAPAALAVDDCNGPADCIGQGTKDIGGDQNQPKLEDGIKSIVNLMLFILGAIAVIMIIIGGIRYATSNGDPGSIKGAKDTILYAVIGLIVAILAYAIVNFVVDAFSGSK